MLANVRKKKENMVIALRLECEETPHPNLLAEWAAFHAWTAHQHPRQSPSAAAVDEAIGRKALYVTARAPDGTIQATGLFTLQPHGVLRDAWETAYCLSGPVCDDAGTLASFLDAVARLPAFRRVGRLRVTPYWLNDEARELQALLASRGWQPHHVETFRQTGWIDLSRTPEEIIASFSKSARRQLRRAEACGIVVRFLHTEDEARIFHASINRLYKKRGIDPVPLEVILADFRSIVLEKGERVILGAFHADRFVAGLQVFRCGTRAHTGHFTSEPQILHEVGNVRIAPILWYSAILWAQNFSVLKIDVEGWKSDAEENDPHYNIYKYKAEFSPEPVLRIGEHSRSVNRLIDLTGSPKRNLVMYARHLRQRLR